MTKITRHDFDIPSLGPAEFPSPLQRLRYEADAEFVTDDEHRVLFDHSLDKVRSALESGNEPATIEHAGARERIFFNPAQTICAVVTCGGLCPGLNDVIRGLVLTLNYSYGVRTIYGIPYGYAGFVSRYGHVPLHLTPDFVSDLNQEGGSVLGSSRGPQSKKEIVDFLVEYNVNILFVIGGDGTLRGAQDIVAEVTARNLKIGVVGIPKTIDNDIEYMDKSFGFETAFAEAVRTVRCAHIEAQGYPNGVGLVKLMGRDSGFIAAFAALAENSVNYVLIPEVPFQLTGRHGLLTCLEDRLARRGHAVVVVAEGAGQHLMQNNPGGTDASGNLKYGDIGPFLKKQIETHFKAADKEINIKYIDPSYVIRSVPASPQDAIYCLRLAQNAVHAAMAGKTNMVVGRWHGHYVNLPMDVVTVRRRKVNPQGDLWLTVLEATGQPAEFK
ncbi:MAG TPA: ATP-dependent 6-phosphofructokinase [Candidatus Methylacidiphilales bacterium]|jgi:6-phosphofructokinase 1|nr:ATP-dependent 6-phosphofructokinase [Candidatus Methylacidiphilales bacterium]